jgi:hypothetical protein
VVRALETICIVTLGLTACYEPPQPDCGFYCGAGGACPEDYTCTADNRCRRNGAADMCVPDAGVVGRDEGGYDGTLVDADITPPMVLMTSPSDAATNVPVTVPIFVQFTEPVFNVSSLTFSAVAGALVIQGQIEVAGVPADYTTHQLTPTDPLPAGEPVTVTLTNQIYDGSGNALATPGSGQLTFTFTTEP